MCGFRSSLAVLLVFLSPVCLAPQTGSPPPTLARLALQLWYWHHSYLTTDNALASSKALLDKAAALGYNGVAIWDSSFNLMGNDWWSPEAESRMREFMQYAVGKHMRVLGGPGLFGMSNDVLQANPNWAEGLRLIGTEYQVDPSGHRLMLKNSFSGLANPGFEDGKTGWFSTGDQAIGTNTVAHSGKVSGVIVDAPGNARFRQTLTLKPWRAYHLRLFFKSSAFRGSPMVSVFDSSNYDEVRLTADLRANGNHDWTQLDYMFNSQDTTKALLYFGVWGGSSGILWFDDVQLEETALVYVLRRPGAPLKLYDPQNPSTIYVEGVDYRAIADPRMTAMRSPFTDVYHAPAPVTLPRGTHLKPGQTVAIDSYSAFPVPIQNGVAMCMSEPAVYKWMGQNAQAMKRVLPPGQGLFIGYDEIRQANSCASCRAKNMSAGQLLAWSMAQSLKIYHSTAPDAQLYTWNDMFDPYHNAHKNYYYVEGDLAGSWETLPANVRIVNWNLSSLKKSLTWFSGADPHQPVAHEQIIAGYYDNGNGGAAAQRELSEAAGVPGIQGLMYTTWADDYSQLESFARAARDAWPAYLASVSKSEHLQTH